MLKDWRASSNPLTKGPADSLSVTLELQAPVVGSQSVGDDFVYKHVTAFADVIKRLKVSMTCGMNSIMRYDITFCFGSLLITVLSYQLIVQPQTSVGLAASTSLERILK